MAEDIKKRNARQRKWVKENRERIDFLMPKGTKDRIKTAAETLGISSGEFIRRAIFKELEEFERDRADYWKD